MHGAAPAEVLGQLLRLRVVALRGRRLVEHRQDLHTLRSLRVLGPPRAGCRRGLLRTLLVQLLLLALSQLLLLLLLLLLPLVLLLELQRLLPAPLLQRFL